MTKFIEPSFSPELNKFPELGRAFQNISAILDGGISFTDNMDVSIVTYTSNGTPDTEDVIPHLLGKVPTGYIPISKDKAGDFYTSSASDDTNLNLKCTVASVTVKLLVF